MFKSLNISMVGREFEKKIIDRLLANDFLSGSFLFFGESQVGKFSFADELTRGLEGNPSVITERMVITGDDSKIGIESVRNIKHFLRSRPIVSPFRSVIIDGAERMTSEAQNAALKIVEEPPSYALIIFIGTGIESVLPTLASRLRKIYFSRVPKRDIASWLVSEKGIDPDKAADIAERSFGRPGLVSDMLNEKKPVKAFDIPKKFDSNKEFDIFVKVSLSKLYNDVKGKDVAPLREFLKRIEAMSRFNTNKKLQLQSIPWTL